MPVTPGTRLGSHEILNAIGAGGMGEVYRARDTKLGRDVAIKILPQAFAGDPDRLARFDREARTLASLNHANIAAIYGIEGTALVMELVDGEDLSAIVARGSMAVPDALSIARQIALALEGAHDAGIIHRDLKPANIKVKADGSVKVLDFGLAKALDSAQARAMEVSKRGPGTLDPRPTMTSPALTGLGMILGTASYMSPEQARGRAVDKRGDLWAFGVVLLEMLTGKTVFAGDTITDVIAAVMTRDPDWQALPVTTPPAIRRLLRRCLEKDPSRRLRDAADARLEIEEALAAPGEGAVAEPSAGRRARRLLWPLATALAFVLGAAVAWLAGPRAVAPTELRRLSIARPNPMAAIRISPDGQWIVAEDSAIRIRRVSESDWRELPGTEGAYVGSSAGGTFWSHDSRYVGFQIGESLKKIDVHGSPPVSICDRCLTPRALRGASWNADGVILVSAGRPDAQQIGLSGIWRIPQNGGEIEEVTSLDAARTDNSHRFPFFLPDGRRFLFTARRDSGEHAIMLGSLDGTLSEQIAVGYSWVAYASGYLLFVRNGSLIATAFDLSSGKTTGDPQTLAVNVQYHPGVGYAQFSVTTDGTLVINEETGERGIGFVDRLGRPTGLVATGIFDGAGRLTRDDTRIVAGFTAPAGPGSADIYVIDLASGQRTQLTTDPRWDQTPAWAPDGKSVMFRAPIDAKHTLFLRAAEGSEPERKLLTATDGGDFIVNDWAPDGTFVLIEKRVPRASRDLVLLPMPAADRLEPWLATTADESDANISPDGRWVAYVSDQSGADEIYVRAFRGGGAGLRVTTRGGAYPVWGKDGKEIFSLDRDGMMVARAVATTAGSVTLGAATILFDAAPLGNRDRPFDIDRRGRFLMNYVEPGPGASRAEILLNWPQAIRR